MNALRWFGGCDCPSITNPHLDSLHHDFCTHKTMMAVTFVQMDKDMAVGSVTPLLGLSTVISYVLSLCLSLIGSDSQVSDFSPPSCFPEDA